MVSNLGRVGRILGTNKEGLPVLKLICPWTDEKGYLKVDFDRSKFRVHRLVLESWIGLRPAGYECRHLDGNKTNNRLDNLEWGTRVQNGQDKVKHGTTNKGKKFTYAMRTRLTDLTKEDVLRIRKLYKTTGMTQESIGLQYGLHQSAISRIVHKENFSYV